MDEVLRFPLLRLPRGALRNMFKIIGLPNIFGISLLSTKAEELIISLELNFGDHMNEMGANITDEFAIYILLRRNVGMIIVLGKVRDDEHAQELHRPVNFLVYGFVQRVYEEMRWNDSRNMSVEQFIDHVMMVFNKRRVMLKFGPDSNRFDLDSIHRTVKDVDTVVAYSDNHEHNQQVLRLFKPPKLALQGNSLEEEKVAANILIQNFEKLQVTSQVKLSFNELLLLNSKEIEMFCVDVSGHDLNRFLKLWMAGSNPNLELIDFKFWEDVVITEGMILTGLGCQDVAEDRFFKLSHAKAKQRVLPGKDIVRTDGIKATIHFEAVENTNKFRMVVWHAHCIAQETDP